MDISKAQKAITIKIGTGEKASCFTFRGNLAQEQIQFEFQNYEPSCLNQDGQDDLDLIKIQDKTEVGDFANLKAKETVAENQFPDSSDQDLTVSQDKTNQEKPRIEIKAVRKMVEVLPEPEIGTLSDQDLTVSQDKTPQEKPRIEVKAIRKVTGGSAEPETHTLSDQDQDLIVSQDKTSQEKPRIEIKAIRKVSEITSEPETRMLSGQDQDLNQDKKREEPVTEPSKDEAKTPLDSEERSTPQSENTGNQTPGGEFPNPNGPLSSYEKRIMDKFEAEAQLQKTAPESLFLQVAWRNKDFHGSWNTIEGQFHVSPFKEVLKLILGSMAAMPGAKAIARNRVKGFFVKCGEQIGVPFELVDLYIVKRQGRIIVRVVYNGKVYRDLTVDQLVREFAG